MPKLAKPIEQDCYYDFYECNDNGVGYGYGLGDGSSSVYGGDWGRGSGCGEGIGCGRGSGCGSTIEGST